LAVLRMQDGPDDHARTVARGAGRGNAPPMRERQLTSSILPIRYCDPGTMFVENRVDLPGKIG